MIYRFGTFTVDPQRVELRTDEAQIVVQPQVYSLLVFLLENRDRVVTKDEVIETVWSGRFVSDSTINARINALRRALGDNGKDQKLVKTFPRRGFRFIANVRVCSRSDDTGKDPGELVGSRDRSGPLDDDYGAPTPNQQSADRPSIAVLPFENMSGDPEQEYFADGIAEDITTALSRFRWFFVIARNSSFSYKGQSPDPRTVAEELGVQYVLEGSVRKVGERVRISVQLIDALTGRQLWADRFDHNLSDIFDTQDEITQHVAAIIAPTIERSEIRRVVTKPPDNLAAWEYCLKGNALIYEMTAEAMLNAREMFASAIVLDPKYSRARSGKALTYSLGLRFLGEADREDGVHNLMAEARKAVELDDADSKAHVTLALAYMYTTPSQSSFAVAEANDAVALNPDDPQANSVLGVALALSANQFDDGALWIEKAVTINPLDPINHIYLSQLALAHLCAERYEKAAEVAEEAIRRRPGFIESHIALASACGYRGRYDDARTAIGEFEDVAQGFVRQHLVFSQDVKAHIILGLDRATLGN